MQSANRDRQPARRRPARRGERAQRGTFLTVAGTSFATESASACPPVSIERAEFISCVWASGEALLQKFGIHLPSGRFAGRRAGARDPGRLESFH
jgi:hypothetical protein